MTLTRFQIVTLGVAGLSATSIGAAIALAPYAFFDSYGIVLGADPSLLSEMRAPGVGLAGLGLTMLAGMIRDGLRSQAIFAALLVFLAFPLGRVIGVIADGWPNSGILAAFAFEICVAVALLMAFVPDLHSAQPQGVAR